MDQRPIGVLDTGTGGLSLVRELQRLMPQESFVCLADTARAPYGDHTRGRIARQAQEGAAFLQTQGVKLIVTACGSISSALAEQPIASYSVPLVTALSPCAQEACAASITGVIGVVGTKAALRGSAFGKVIRNIRSDTRVVGRCCPLLAAFAQEGRCSPEDTTLHAALSEAFEPLLAEGIDTLLLASTHYAPLFNAITAAVERDVTVLDCCNATARYVQAYLVQNGLQSEGKPQTTAWCVTESPDDFLDAVRRAYGEPLLSQVSEVVLPEL